MLSPLFTNNRPIAIVKRKNRPHCVIKYDYNQPGLYFGIVPLITCDKVVISFYLSTLKKISVEIDFFFISPRFAIML